MRAIRIIDLAKARVQDLSVCPSCKQAHVFGGLCEYCYNDVALLQEELLRGGEL